MGKSEDALGEPGSWAKNPAWVDIKDRANNMSLREYFAYGAMVELVGPASRIGESHAGESAEWIASRAYHIADAMIERRRQSGT